MPKIKLTPEQIAQINLRNPAALGAAALGDFENAVIASTPGGIIAQEKAGQTMLVADGALLPRRIEGYPQKTREQVTAATGIVFGEDHDNLFVRVTLPAGWKIVPTDHNMWTDLLDADGCKRAGIFYKAAFYDRNAHIMFEPRYSIDCDYAEPTNTVYITDHKAGKTIQTIGTCPHENYAQRDELYGVARLWMQREHPNWQDPFAYWSDQ